MFFLVSYVARANHKLFLRHKSDREKKITLFIGYAGQKELKYHCGIVKKESDTIFKYRAIHFHKYSSVRVEKSPFQKAINLHITRLFM